MDNKMLTETPPSSPIQKERYNGKRVLVVDCNPETRREIVSALEQKGYSAESAKNGREGLNRFGFHQSEINGVEK